MAPEQTGTMGEAPARVKTSLESEVEKLMSQAKELSGTADKSKENAAKTRRKSRDLEEQLSEMSAGDKWNAVGMGRQRRVSRDYTPSSLKEAFQAIDADSSGYIDHAELEQVSTLSGHAGREGGLAGLRDGQVRQGLRREGQAGRDAGRGQGGRRRLPALAGLSYRPPCR